MDDNESQAYVYNILTSPPLLQILTQKVPVKALLDTGSSISIINEKFYKILSTSGSPRLLSLNPPIASAVSVSGHDLSLKGSVMVWFKLGKANVAHHVQVMENCPHDCILGADFLSRFGEVRIDLIRHVVHLGPDLCIPLISSGQSTESRVATVVKLPEPMVIPPLSDALIYGDADLSGMSGPFLFEPRSTTDLGLSMAHGVVDSSPQPIKMINNTRAPIILFRGQT
ncbi:MAG: retroviral-like aspartic protease, partial [bacterium]|nr:retroviral-like aspartic protease [bacterium]